MQMKQATVPAAASSTQRFTCPAQLVVPQLFNYSSSIYHLAQPAAGVDARSSQLQHSKRRTAATHAYPPSQRPFLTSLQEWQPQHSSHHSHSTLPAFAGPLLALLAGAWAVSRFVQWFQQGASTIEQQPSLSTAAGATGGAAREQHATPAQRWVRTQLQQQGVAPASSSYEGGDGTGTGAADPALHTAAAAAPPPPVAQLICCLRIPDGAASQPQGAGLSPYATPGPYAAPSGNTRGGGGGGGAAGGGDAHAAAAAVADVLRRCVDFYSRAPASPPITGLLACYPACAVLVLEGEQSCLCALMRELVRPPSADADPAPPSSSSSSSPSSSPSSSTFAPFGLGLSPSDVRTLSFNPDIDSRQFSDWYETRLSPSPTLSTLRLGRNLPSSMPPTNPSSQLLGSDLSSGAANGLPSLGLGSLGSGTPFLTQAELTEAAEAVGLFVNLLAAKLQGTPGLERRQRVLDEPASYLATLPSPHMVLGLAGSEVAPPLDQFLEQYDVGYEQYCALACSGELDRFEQEYGDGGYERHGGDGRGQWQGDVDEGRLQGDDGGGQRPGGDGGVALDAEEQAAVRELRRLSHLYRRHLLLELQQELQAATPSGSGSNSEAGGGVNSPLAKYYPANRRKG